MERYTAKVNRCVESLHNSHDNIEAMKRERDRLNPNMVESFFVDTSSARAVAKHNDRIDQARRMHERIDDAIDRHNDLVEKRKEAEEEAKEALEELTREALHAIDEDISMVINRLEGVVSNLANSDDADDLLAAIDVCTIGLRVYAMFDDSIEDSSARKECKEGIEKINKTFATLCAQDSMQNYMADIYRRNLDLVQNNAAVAQQIDEVLASVDQKQIDAHFKSIDAVLATKVNTKFDYNSVIDPAVIDKIVVDIKNAIDSLKLNIEKAKACQCVTAAIELGKAGGRRRSPS